jgi:hypothetical protein
MSQSIDWAYWQKLPELRIFEAVALLHGTEPESEPPDDASPEYRKTLRLLLACLSDRSTFTPGARNIADPALHSVKLAEVGRWALTNGYKLPEGFPHLATVTSVPSIDWHFWKAMRTVKLWQACALIAGLDPDKLRPPPHAWMAGPGAGPVFESKSFSSPDNKTRFEKALRLAESAVSYMDGPIYPKGQPHPGNNKEKDVLLSEVAAYFRSIEWVDIPAALQSIAVPPAPATQQETTVEKVPVTVAALPKQRAQEARILELLKAQGYEPLTLAQRTPGKPGPKAEIRTLALNEPAMFSAKTFDTAWQRLRDTDEIAGAE